MKKELSYGNYYSKVMGGLVGKFIGGTIGGPLEGDKRLHSLTFYREMPKIAACNDDNDYLLLNLHCLQDRGIHINARDLMEENHTHANLTWVEYGYAAKNWNMGIYPPVSGWFNNGFYKECMGCPVRSELWGFMCPGNPELAARYAKMDGELDHAANSVWAEMFLAAMEAELFFESDIHRLIAAGKAHIPADCRLAECVEDIVRWQGEGQHWLMVRQRILNKYGSPDMTSMFQNVGFTVLALLEGNGDFEKTMLTAANCGYDADCSCATAGAILGAILGIDNIPQKWKDPIGDHYTSMFDFGKDNRISSFGRETCQVGVWVARELNKTITITDVPPEIIQGIGKLGTKGRKNEVDLEVDYGGDPVIEPKTLKKVVLKLRNKTSRTIRAELKMHLPEGIECNEPLLKSIEIPALLVKEVPCTFSMVGNFRKIPHKNLITVEVVEEKKTLLDDRFGVVGTNVWTAFGAFWAPLNPKRLPPCNYVPHLTADGQPADLLPMETFMSNEIDLDEEYINNEAGLEPDRVPDPDHGQVFEKKTIYAHEDKINLDAYFQMKGPGVIYLLRYFDCPDDRKAWLVIGSNDGFKLWLNDNLIASRHDHFSCNPCNHSFDVSLRKGRNKILIKLGRCGDHFDFQFGIRQLISKHWHQEHWMTDLAEIIFS
jgi:ADP-ribosylglycohydrolase